MTLHTHRWRQGRTVVSRGDDMQMTHLKATGMRCRERRAECECERTHSVGFSMSQPYISLSSNALRRGTEPSAGESFKMSDKSRR